MQADKGSILGSFIEGLRDGGCEFVANYPGTHSQDIFFELGGDRISINEKVAFERAYGASVAGKRSVVSMKNVGLNTCSDQYLHSTLTGVNAGFVVVVTDDTKVTGSQEREDSRHFFDFFGGLWIEPFDQQSAYDAGYEAFELSEKFDVPVTIRLTSQAFTPETSVYQRKRVKQGVRHGKKQEKDKMIAYPIYWKRQADNLQQKQIKIRNYVEALYDETHSARGVNGALVVGASEEEFEKWASDLGDESFDRLNVSHYPLPLNAIDTFTKELETLTIFEQGDDYVRAEVVKSRAEKLVDLKVVSHTGNSPDLADHWIVWDHLEKLFKALSLENPSFVIGDVGQYTVETHHVVDACLCLGSAVGVTLGVAEADRSYPYCIVGDGSFLHGNVSSLNEAVERGVGFGTIIVDNGGSMATGGQPIMGNVRQSIPASIPVYECDYDNSSMADFRRILGEMKGTNVLAVLIVKLKKGM